MKHKKDIQRTAASSDCEVSVSASAYYNPVLDPWEGVSSPRNGLWGPLGSDPTEDWPDENMNDDLLSSHKDEEKKPLNDPPQEKAKPPQQKSKLTALQAFSVDLTAEAAAGRLDPVIGREKELERLMLVLCRRRKNNPVLIGEPGVGKSVVVEGLAQRIVEKKVPMLLLDKRIILLNTTLMVAGTKYRGEFENRVSAVLKEVKNNPDIILFIDEIHTIIGTGKGEDSMELSNMLKPALSRGELRCIGASTLGEYSRTIEKDGALERRFQKIMLEPNTPEETLEILRRIKSHYEKHHNVIYTDEALEQSVALTDRYVTGRFFPDKAIDAIDEAGAGMQLITPECAPELEELQKKMELYKQNRYKEALEENYELAADWRDKERQTSIQIDKLMYEIKNNRRRQVVDADVVAKVIGRMTGIPTERIATSEKERLKDLYASLNREVIGQEEAVTKVTKAIQRNRLGLRDAKRPIGTFLFLGPTGVGKTYLAKKLAEQLFGDEKALIRIDLSEYSEKMSTSRLTGAAPGYVGYQEGGQLTEKVRHRPYSVVLLDEIEKAHPDVFNHFLQVLDEGMLTDSQGRKVDFKNTVLILTGNVGSRKLSEFGTGMGFRPSDNVQSENDNAHHLIDKELKKTFSPEFLNRLDGIVHFNSLSTKDIEKIIDLKLRDLLARVTHLGYGLEISSSVKKELVKKSYDAQYGARPVNRMLQTEIEDRLTDLILQGEAREGDTVFFKLEKGKIVPSIHQKKKEIEVK